MPQLIPLIPMIISGLGAGASIGGSIAASGSKTTTSTPTLSPGLQAGQTASLNDLMGILQNPSAGLAPVQQAGADSINRSFATMPQTATQALAGRGFGSSGQVGDAVYDTEGARLDAQSGLYGQMASLASSRQLSADQIMQSMISSGKGTTTTGPNQSVAGGLLSGGSALSNLTVLQTLQHMINNGGSTPAATPTPTPNLTTGSGTGAGGMVLDESGWGN